VKWSEVVSKPVKLLMMWDIKPGQEEPYFDFITQEFPTNLQHGGLQLTEAWYTVYGNWPQVRMGFVTADLQTLEQFLESDLWVRVRKELSKFIMGYRQKVVPARGSFQL